MNKEIIATGHEAIALAEADPSRVQLNKYTDPTEDAEADIEIGKAREVASEDPGLIFATIRSKPGYTDDVWSS